MVIKIVNYFLSAIYFQCVDFGCSSYYMKDELLKTFVAAHLMQHRRLFEGTSYSECQANSWVRAGEREREEESNVFVAVCTRNLVMVVCLS